MKCGDAYFDITELQETSPCEYWIEVETSLLCKEGTKKVVTTDEDIPSKGKDDSVIFSGVLCHTYNIFDEAAPFIHLEGMLELRRRHLGEEVFNKVKEMVSTGSLKV